MNVQKIYGIPKELFSGLNPETRRILFKSADDDYMLKVGGSRNYDLRYRPKRKKGKDYSWKEKFKTMAEFKKWKAKKYGYNSWKAYEDALAKKKGYANYAEKKRKRMRALKTSRINGGMCSMCGKPRTPNYKTCSPCREKDLIRWNKRKKTSV